MSDLWYVVEGADTRGPLSLAELVSHLLGASNPEQVLVWRKGFDGWKPVSAVGEVAGQLVRPPALRPASPSVVEPPRQPAALPIADGDDTPNLEDFKPPLSGIQGWLALVAVGQVLAPIRLIVTMMQYYADAEPKLFQQFPVAMWGEATLNAGLLALFIYTAVLLFRKSRKFPTFFIYQWLAGIFLPLINLVWVALTLSLYTGRPFAEFAGLDPQTVGQSIAAMIGAAIWISYILKSRRVANTFTQ